MQLTSPDSAAQFSARSRTRQVGGRQAWSVRQIPVSMFLCDLYRVFFVPNKNGVRQYRLPIRSGLVPDGCVLAYWPLVRQNKVGGGRAPDQPERPDCRTEQKSHKNYFCELRFVAQSRLGLAFSNSDSALECDSQEWKIRSSPQSFVRKFYLIAKVYQLFSR